MSFFSIILCIVLLFLVAIIHKVIIQPYLLVLYYRRQGISNAYYSPIFGRMKTNKQNAIDHGDFFYFHKQTVKKDPNIKACVSNLGSSAIILLIDPQLKKEFLFKQQFYKKSGLGLAVLGAIMENGLVMSEGEEWKRHRAILSKTFSYDFLKRSVPTIISVSKNGLASIESKPQVEIISEIEKIAGEVVGNLFFGANLNKPEYFFEGLPLTLALANLLQEATTSVRNIITILIGLPLIKLGIIPSQRKAFARVKRFRTRCLEIIKERKRNFKYGEATDTNYKDFLDILFEYEINNPDKFSEKEILDEFITFFLAGMDTTGHTIAMALYHFSQHPEYLEMARMETSKWIGKEETLTIEDINKFEFINAFLKETLRTSTPLPALIQRVATLDHKLGNYNIKKGTLVSINLLFDNFNHKYYEKPEEFNPLRWTYHSTDNSMDPFVFMPFSGGPRNCIGQHLSLIESKIILLLFINKFDFKVIKGYKHKMTMSAVYKPMNPLIFDLSPLS